MARNSTDWLGRGPSADVCLVEIKSAPSANAEASLLSAIAALALTSLVLIADEPWLSLP
jgi:hypothetical protein